MNRGRVVVAGGSLGGLTAGLLLGDLGLDVTIHERSPAELEQRGAGIGFLPDSYRYLVERAGVRARRHQRRRRAGSATSTAAATSSTTRPTSTGSARGTPSTGGCSAASTGAATSSVAR